MKAGNPIQSRSLVQSSSSFFKLSIGRSLPLDKLLPLAILHAKILVLKSFGQVSACCRSMRLLMRQCSLFQCFCATSASIQRTSLAY
jgi:hypothetical protein